MARKPPVEAYQLAETYRLGKPTAAYDTGFENDVKIRFAFLCVPTMVLFSQALCTTGCNFTNHTALVYFILLGICLLLSLMLFLSLLTRISTRHICVYICVDGLIYKSQKEIHIIYWERVEAIYTTEN